jgi:hypothetical protein
MSTFQPGPDDEVPGLWGGTLPTESCYGCSCVIKRRQQRVYVRATWRGAREVLCQKCWIQICTWAARCALHELALELV